MPFNKCTCNDAQSKGSVISSNKILSQYCSDKGRALLIENMQCIRYIEGEMIFYEHQPVQLVYLISSGKVKLWKEGVHKDKQIIYFAKDGDLIGYWGCLENKEYSLSATALEDTDICYIKKEIFFETRKTMPLMHFKILQQYTRKLKKTEDHLRNMAEMNMREKIAKALLMIADNFGTMKDNITLSVCTSRHDIAALAGISVDRVGIQLKEFREEGLITPKNQKKLAINQKALKKIIAPYLV